MMVTSEIKILRLEAENRRIWDTRLCWRDHVRICDTDRGNNSSCGRPATILWIQEDKDTLYLCGQECVDYYLSYHYGTVREIGSAHGLTVYEFTSKDEDDDQV